MADSNLRDLERLGVNDPSARAAYRFRLRSMGGSAGLDLGIPYGWEFVGLDSNLSYGDALGQLRERCYGDALQPFLNGVPRPLTLKEMLEFIVCNPKSQDDFPELDTCSAVIYPARQRPVDKFKLVQLSVDLLESKIKGWNLPIDLRVVEGRKLFLAGAVYDLSLEKGQALRHPAWCAVVDGDATLLSAYVDAAFSSRRHSMAFNLENYVSIGGDFLLCLSVKNYGAVACRYLSHHCSFLRVCPKGAK